MFSKSRSSRGFEPKLYKKLSQDDNRVKVQYLSEKSINHHKIQGYSNLLRPETLDELKAEIKKFDQFLEINQNWSNNVRSHFEVKEVEDVEQNKPVEALQKIAYDSSVRDFLQVLSPLSMGFRLTEHDKINLVTIKLMNYPCANDRVTNTVTLSNFSPGEKQCLFFQIYYIKYIFQLLKYKLDKDAFYRSVCIHQLPKPTTFIYIIGYVKYVFVSEYFISMSLLDTIPDVASESKAAEGTQTGYATRSSQSQTTERLMDELKNKFLSRNLNIPAAFYKLFTDSLNTFKCELYTEEALALGEGDLLFYNYPKSLYTRYQAQNVNFNTNLDSLRDTYSIYKCAGPKKKGQKACNLSKDFFDKKIETLNLTNQKQKLGQKVQTFNNLFSDLTTATTQLERNEPVFTNNAYSSIFLTEGK